MKNVFLLLLTIILPCCSWGQFGPEQLMVDSPTKSPTSVLTADIDGDGDIDIISRSYNERGVLWFENIEEEGRFEGPLTINNIKLPESIAIADIDGDDDPDIISASPTPEGIVWHENIDGLGDFVEEQTIYQGIDDTPTFVHSADLDGDGDMDIISASYYQGRLAWYENVDGLGSFGPQLIISNDFLGIRYAYSADMDGDGDIDVLSASLLDGKIFWFRNDGEGNFSEGSVISLVVSGNIIYPINLVAADLDGDGDMDILSGPTENSEPGWYENEDGLGSFGPQQSISGQGWQLRTVHASDIDGDGDLDVLSTAGGDVNLVWYENENGLGDFGSQQIIPNSLRDLRWASIVDIDGDSDVDILSCSAYDNYISINQNLDGIGTFGPEIRFYNSVDRPKSICAVDLDSDGDLDILVGSESDCKVTWFENEGGIDNFKQQHDLPFPEGSGSQGLCRFSIIAADIDGDNDNDILFSYRGKNRIAWFENADGMGDFQEEQIITTSGKWPNNVLAVDVDNDGDMDILSSSDLVDNNKVSWYKNESGLGDFGDEQIISFEVDSVSSIYSADLDGDGDQDLLSTSSGDDKVAWYRNQDGLGSFGDQIIISDVADGANAVFAADLDNDSDLDIISTSSHDNKIAWYENEDGLGTFGDEQILAIIEDVPLAVQSFDIDQDDDEDIVVASSTGNGIIWFENKDGLGDFGIAQLISNDTILAKTFTIGDLDTDGDSDILFTFQFPDKVAWCENDLKLIEVSGTCYFDENENGQFDSSELGLKNQNVIIEPDAFSSWTNGSGDYRFFLEEGDYTLSHQPNPNWELTTTGSVDIVVNSTDPITQNFGLKPLNNISEVVVDLTSGPTRCGFTVPYWLQISNEGTQILNGTIVLEIDPSVTLIEATPEPTLIAGNTLTWEINGLYPTYEEYFKLKLEMPGVNQLGEQIEMVAEANLSDILGNDIEDAFYYSSTIQCAYDPNDKLVAPDPAGNENYTLFNDTLKYTIRFQNTGTDTAFNVIIEDQLDEGLDWSTFQPIASSHDYTVFFYDTGLVEFRFQDILLPDSTTNEIASHGFIKYQISPKTDLEESTVVKNFASIFFDFNPPIITNETINTLVSMLPTSTIDLDQQSRYVKIFPNPFLEHTTLVTNSIDTPSNYRVRFCDITGRCLEEYSLNESGALHIQREQLPSGLYFYQLIEEQSNQIIEIGKMVAQ